jgi:hypothetical protein
LCAGLKRFRRERGDERCALEQAAEIFFTGVAVLAALGLESGLGLVTDFETFEMNDAYIFPAAFPDLALLQFHAGRFISLAFKFKRDEQPAGYFFLPAADLAAMAALFFALALITLDCFWPDFF